MKSLLKSAGLNWAVPDFSTLSRRQRTLSVAILFSGSSGPLHLLTPSHGLQANHRRAVDSTGIKAEGEGEWNALKHGRPKRRLWRKTHIGIDEQTFEIRAVEVTSSSIGPLHGSHTNHCRALDAPMLLDQLDQIPTDQEIGSVTEDGACDSRKCHDAIAAYNAPAVIPPGLN